MNNEIIDVTKQQEREWKDELEARLVDFLASTPIIPRAPLLPGELSLEEKFRRNKFLWQQRKNEEIEKHNAKSEKRSAEINEMLQRGEITDEKVTWPLL